MKTASNPRLRAGINLKVLGLLCLIVLAAVGSVVALHRWRTQTQVQQALILGTAAFERSDFLAAARHLRKYLSDHPEDPDVLTRFAQANLAIRPVQADRVAAAIGAYRRLFNLRPDDPKVWTELVRVYSGIGQHNEAAYICRQRLARKPDDPSALYALGKSQIAQRQFDEAVEVLARLSSVPINDAKEKRLAVRAFGLLSAVELQKDEPESFDRAARWLDRAIEEYPESAEARVQRARFWTRQRKDADAARRDLEAAESLECADPGVRLALVEEWVSLGETDRARPHFATIADVGSEILAAYDIDPEAWVYTYAEWACRLALADGEPDRALPTVKAALAKLYDQRRLNLIPAALETYLAAGHIEEARGLVEEYQAELRRRTNVQESTSDQAALMAASVAEAAQEPVAVLASLDGLSPQGYAGATPWKFLWRACERTGQFRRAQRALEEYVSRSPNDVDALKALARSSRGRDWRKMRWSATRATELAPDDLDARLLSLEARIKTAPAGTEGAQSLQSILAELDGIEGTEPRAPALDAPPTLRVAVIHLLKAAVAFRNNNPNTSLSLLEKAARECRPDPDVDLALVELYGRLDQPQQALEACRRAVERNPSASAPVLRLAELEQASGAGSEAIRALTDAVARTKCEDRLQVQLALVHYRMYEGDREAGLALLGDVARENPDDVRPRLALLAQRETQNDAPATQRLISELKRIEGPRDGLLWRLEQARAWARAHEWRQHVEPIESLLRECMAADPRWSAPVLLLGQVFEQMARNDPAEELYRRFVDSNPDANDVLEQWLLLYERQGRYAEVEQILRRLPPDADWCAEHRLNLALAKGDHDTALAEIERQLTRQPKNVSLRVAQAGLLFGIRRDADAALQILDEAQALDPDGFEIIETRASILNAAGREGELLALLDTALQRPDDVRGRVLRARFLAARGRTQEAENAFLDAIQLESAGPDAFAALGQFYVEAGRLTDAIAVYDRGLARHPDTAHLKRELIRVLEGSTDAAHRTRARAMVEDFSQTDADDPALLLTAAELKLKEATPRAVLDAESLLEGVLARDPHNAAAHIRLIEIARRKGDSRDVQAKLARALGACLNNLDIRLIRADVEREAGNTALARELAQSVLDEASALTREASPSTAARRWIIGACTLLADLSINGGDIESARRFAERAAQTDPHSELGNLTQAKTLDAAGQTNEAVALLESFHATDHGRDCTTTRVALADLYRRKGRLDAAEAALEEAMRQEGQTPLILGAQFRLWAAQNHHERIAAHLKEISPGVGLEPATVRMGAALLASSGNAEFLAQAVSICNQLIAERPQDLEAQVLLAQAAYRLPDLATAESAYRKVLQFDPYHATALNDLAWIVGVDRGRLDEGLALADKGAHRFPNDSHLLDTRGVLLFRLGRYAEAKADFERCLLSSAPTAASRARTQFNLGRVLVKLDKPAEAGLMFAEALRLDKDLNVFSDLERSEMGAILRTRSSD